MTPENQPIHPIERAILRSLKERRDFTDIDKVAVDSHLSLDQVRRAVEWLRAKQLIEVSESETVDFSLGPEGERAVSEGLPERKLVRYVERSGGSIEIGEAAESLGEEFAIALGVAKKNDWITVVGNKISLKPSSKEPEPEELVLQKLESQKSIPKGELAGEDLKTISTLLRRRESFIIESRTKKTEIRPTKLGFSIASSSAPDEIDRISPEIIISGVEESSASGHRCLFPLF